MGKKNFLDLQEAKTLIFWRDVFADGLGTFYMMVFVNFSFVTLNTESYKPTLPLVGLMVGLVIFLLIEGFRPISGGHLNPCVSFAGAVAGRITVVRAFCYTVSQCSGSVLASLLVIGLTPSDYRSAIVAFKPAAQLSDLQSVFVEAVLIFNLIFVGLNVSEPSQKDKGSMPGLPTGLGVGTAVMAAGTFTGVCINPIVAFGPAVAKLDFEKHWVYWVGDYVGATGAVLLFKLFRAIQFRHDRLTKETRDPYQTEQDGGVFVEDEVELRKI